MGQVPTVNILRLVLVDNDLIVLMLHTINKVVHVMYFQAWTAWTGNCAR